MEQEMRKMQQEAIHRVNEMQSRAKKHLQEERPPSPEPAQKQVPPSPREMTAPASTGKEPETLLDGLMQDQERTLILMLLLLLFTDNADPAGIFSLLYLIL